jgi:NADH dehydrogenase FAD-containing subunit
VEGVYEILPHPGGLTRNVVQCLHDYNIPLHLSHTITDIKGKKRVEGVTVAEVDSQFNPIKGTERYIPCDTVILSVGLIPENELSQKADVEIDLRTGGPVVDENMETSIPGIFACGNVVHVHDLVDDVSEAAETAGRGAAAYVKGKQDKREHPVTIESGKNVRYVIPHIIRGRNIDDITAYLRVKEIEKDTRVIVSSERKIIFEKKERIVRPPEMVKIHLSSDILNEIGNKLLFEVTK